MIIKRIETELAGLAQLRARAIRNWNEADLALHRAKSNADYIDRLITRLRRELDFERALKEHFATRRATIPK